jgi:hypothetical protein
MSQRSWNVRIQKLSVNPKSGKSSSESSATYEMAAYPETFMMKSRFLVAPDQMDSFSLQSLGCIISLRWRAGMQRSIRQRWWICFFGRSLLRILFIPGGFGREFHFEEENLGYLSDSVPWAG